MKAIAFAVLILSVPLAGGCATAREAAVVSAVGTCSAAPAQGLLGTVATAQVGAELLRLTGASQLRWVAPDTAVTMDYRDDRLTVGYDRAMRITSIACN